MQQQVDNLIKECREWIRMKRAYDNARYPDAGTSAYVVSGEWLAKYKKYICYDVMKFNNTPEVNEAHFEDNHPGPMTNSTLLQKEAKFLKGTGTLTGFEHEVIDTYLHKDVRERTDFEFINEEMWTFLKEKYGCDTAIKRYYASKGAIYSICEIDSRYRLIPVFIVRADDLYADRITEESFKLSYVQMSAKKSFTELKKRMADVISA